jgi:bifunctional DNase/RNase
MARPENAGEFLTRDTKPGEKGGKMFIRMKVAGLTLDSSSNTPVLILRDEEEKHLVPIWIGIVEASAIATELEKIPIARPMTHDLLKNLVTELGATVERVEVTDLRENTYFAAIHLRTAGGHHVIDARPSDAVALALRAGASIFVEERVIQMSTRGGGSPGSSKSDKDKWTEFLESLDPEDFGKYKM